MDPIAKRPHLGHLAYTYDAQRHRNGVKGDYLGETVEIQDGRGHIGDVGVDLREDVEAGTGWQTPFRGSLGGRSVEGTHSIRWLPKQTCEHVEVERSLHRLETPSQALEVDFQIRQGEEGQWRLASGTSGVRSLSGSPVNFELVSRAGGSLDIVGEPPDRAALGTVLSLLPSWDDFALS